MAKRDYYEVLGVDKSASDPEIKKVKLSKLMYQGLFSVIPVMVVVHDQGHRP